MTIHELTRELTSSKVYRDRHKEFACLHIQKTIKSCLLNACFSISQRWVSPVAPLRVGQLGLCLRLLPCGGVHGGVERGGVVGEHVVHGGVDLVAVDGSVGQRIADGEAGGPQFAPYILVQLPQAGLGHADRLHHGVGRFLLQASALLGQGREVGGEGERILEGSK